jgi:dicarboxylate transporter DctA-like protein
MRRRFLGITLSVFVLLALGGATLWVYRVEFATWAVMRLIERQGLGPARLAVDAIGLRGLRAHDVALRAGAIAANEVTVSYNPIGLVALRLDRVEIGGLTVSLGLAGDGVELGGRPLATASGGTAASASLDINALILRDARFSLETAAAKVEATISATLALAGGTIDGTAVTARVAAPVAGILRTADIDLKNIHLEPHTDGGVRLTLAQATVTPAGLPWMAQAIDGELAWQPGEATAQLAIGRLLNRQQPILAVPLSLSASASLTGPHVDFTILGELGGKERGSKSTARLEAKGRHDRSSGSGSATIVLEPVMFHRGSVEPGDLAPALGGMVEDVEGSVGLGGTLRWSSVAVTPDLTLHLGDLAFAAAGMQLRALTGDIKVDKLWLPATPPGQTVTATIEAAGLSPAKLSLAFQLAAAPALKLERIAVDVAGGEIVATPFTIDPASAEIATTLAVDHVDLAEVTKLLSIEGLSGTGQLDGKIPIDLKGGTVAISGGRLAARNPGVLSYQPSTLPPEIAKAGGSVELALKALSDFHYDTLALDLDKSSGGEGTVLLRLQGHNPAVMSGQPFNFNIRIDSNFDRLADYALLSLRSAQELLRKAAQEGGR